LGFGLKWDMGWMHDTLSYLERDPIHGGHHHGEITFRAVYAFTENYVLPLSHDEVTHGKGSLIAKMPGDRWQRFANLRALYGYMWAHPGKKLLFMGSEFAQWREWSHDAELEWSLLDDPAHAGMQRLVSDLNRVYRTTPALHEIDFEMPGFEWIIGDDREASVVAFLRRARSGSTVLVVSNFTPVPRVNYVIGVPQAGYWRETLNSDAPVYAGSGMGNLGGVQTAPVAAHGRFQSLTLTLPPLATIFLELSRE
jgi:1,4-alpha-glucan branching enzyme